MFHSDDAARYSDCMRECKTLNDLESIVNVLTPLIEKLPNDLKEWLRDEYRSTKQSIEAKLKEQEI